MRIAIFTDTYYPDVNGVARTLKRLTDYLEEQQIDYKIFAPDCGAHEYISDQIHRLKSMPFFLYPECRLAFPNLSALRSELQAFSPDLIHVATPFNIGLCGVYLAKRLNIPLVGSYHTNFDEYLRYYNLPFLSKVHWKFMHWFYRNCKRIFVPSPATFQLLKQQGFSNLALWPRGVDCQQFHPHYDHHAVKSKFCPPHHYLLTYIGRLAPEKDLHTLLAITKALPASLSQHIHWLIAGDGPMREELEMQAPANMTFTGYLSGTELAEVYAASDLFIFPSPTETFGNVVLESLASGTPVIGARAGGVQHIIHSGTTGLLCAPGNVQEFTDAIAQLLMDDSLRRHMGQAGQAYALTQNWEQIWSNLINQYTYVLEEQKDLSEQTEQKYA